jgi:hypothetical protein
MRPSKRFSRPADTPGSETTAPRRVFHKGRYSTAPPLVVDLNEETPSVDEEGRQLVIDHTTPAASYGEGFSKYDGRSLGGPVVIPGEEAAGAAAIEPDDGNVMLEAEPEPEPTPETLTVDLTVRLGAWGTERRYESDRYWRKDSRRI